MSRFSIITISAAIFFACTALARSEDVVDVLARVRTLNDAGEPSDATAALARAVSRTMDPQLISEWITINTHWGDNVESHQSNKKMPPLPVVDEAEFKKKAGSAALDLLKKEYTEHLYGLNPFGPYARAFGATDAFYRDIRRQLDQKVPAVRSEQEVSACLRTIEDYGRSAFSCEARVSLALQSAPANEIESLLRLRAKAKEQTSRAQKLRAAFVSYDHIAPRVIRAHVALIPDAFGVTGPYVTMESLRQAAEMLGESGRDLEFAHKDVKRLWLDAISKLKQAAGKEQFKDLETLATVVANSKTTPDQWEAK